MECTPKLRQIKRGTLLIERRYSWRYTEAEGFSGLRGQFVIFFAAHHARPDDGAISSSRGDLPFVQNEISGLTLFRQQNFPSSQKKAAAFDRTSREVEIRIPRRTSLAFHLVLPNNGAMQKLDCTLATEHALFAVKGPTSPTDALPRLAQ